MKVSFAGGAYKHRSLRVDAQECINFYAEMAAPESKEPTCLIGTPGMKRFATYDNGGVCRGLHAIGSGDRMFAVIGKEFCEITGSGGVIVRGELTSSNGMVSMADNGLQLIVSDRECGYIFNLKAWTDNTTKRKFTENTWDIIRDKDVTFYIGGDTTSIVNEFPKCSHVVFKDGYFVANKLGTGAVFVSRYYDGTIWDAGQYAIAEGMPDNVMALVCTNNELWVFGAKSTEVWFTSGQSSYPFSRVQGAFVDIGIIAPRSAASNGASVFWLGSNTAGNNIIFAGTGYNPQRISTHAIEFMLSRMPRTDDAIGFCYQQEGHNFYVLTFPTGNKTIVYDLTTGLWHERAAWNKKYAQYRRHRAIAHCVFQRKNIIGTHDSGNLYEWALDTHTDDGEEIRSVRAFPHIHDYARRIVYRRMVLDVESGTALQQSKFDAPYSPQQTGIIQSGQGSDPQIMLQWSDDGGYTWSGEMWGSVGRVGEYKHRIVFRNLGSAFDRVFRFIYTDPVPRVFLKADIDITA